MSHEEDKPLPYGWVKQHDSNYNRYFYVDTKATPPRSIWVHPYEDEQYLREHPDIREKVGNSPGFRPPPDAPPGSRSPRAESSTSSSSSKRGFFGKIKDKTVGTKEERQAARLREERFREMRRQALIEENATRRAAMEQQMQQRLQQRSSFPGQSPQGYSGGYQAYPQQGYAPQQFGQPAYAAAAPRRGGMGGGMGGMALPLIGGLAGGLLLGDLLDSGDGGGFGDGGDGGFGGDGGDFGGGDGGFF